MLHISRVMSLYVSARDVQEEIRIKWEEGGSDKGKLREASDPNHFVQCFGISGRAVALSRGVYILHRHVHVL